MKKAPSRGRNQNSRRSSNTQSTSSALVALHTEKQKPPGTPMRRKVTGENFVGVWVKAEFASLIESVAAAEGMDQSEFVRKAAREKLDRNRSETGSGDVSPASTAASTSDEPTSTDEACKTMLVLADAARRMSFEDAIDAFKDLLEFCQRTPGAERDAETIAPLIECANEFLRSTPNRLRGLRLWAREIDAARTPGDPAPPVPAETCAALVLLVDDRDEASLQTAIVLVSGHPLMAQEAEAIRQIKKAERILDESPTFRRGREVLQKRDEAEDAELRARFFAPAN